ncbi:MAG: class II glutamine amidotransferase [Polyangiaceae bacterium]
MARLFGLIGNRADLAGRVLALEADPLRVHRSAKDAAGKDAGPLGWGVGFYQSGEVLMRRRPIDDRADIDVAKNCADVRADVMIGHVRMATVGALRTENTHPFRYRQWLFAQTGTIPAFDSLRERLIASVPEFLRGDIRGETDSEVLFHIFLSFLHDAGRLNDAAVDDKVVGGALRSTLQVVDQMAAEVGTPATPINMLVTNGDFIVALRRDIEGGSNNDNGGNVMAYRTVGKDDADRIALDDPQLRRRSHDFGNLRFVIIASDFDSEPPARWKRIGDRAVVTITRNEDPKIEAF